MLDGTGGLIWVKRGHQLRLPLLAGYKEDKPTYEESHHVLPVQYHNPSPPVLIVLSRKQRGHYIAEFNFSPFPRYEEGLVGISHFLYALTLHSWGFLHRITHHCSLTLRFFFSVMVILILFHNNNDKDDRDNIMFYISPVT